MPTKKRIWYPGCTYHITARGNHRNDIFRDEADFGMYMIQMLKFRPLAFAEENIESSPIFRRRKIKI